MQNTHYLKLAPLPFTLIKEGKKSVELRLFDEKRQKIKVGDFLIFTNLISGEILKRIVIKIEKYPTFKELYTSVNQELLGYLPHEVAHYEEMYHYYTLENIRKYGVIAIFLQGSN